MKEILEETEKGAQERYGRGIEKERMTSYGIATSFVASTYFMGGLIDSKIYKNASVRWIVMIGMGVIPAYCFV